MNQIFFWTQKDKYGVFSNFTKSPFTLDGREWATVEHYYQAMKSPYLMEQENIRSAKTPFAAKMLGRKVELSPMWEDSKYPIMKNALYAKFTQNPEMGKLLVSTVNATIYEDSPKDFIWGTGMRGGVGAGRNLLGNALMEVRDVLILDVTEKWHKNGFPEGTELHQALGWTQEQYAAWLEMRSPKETTDPEAARD